MKKRSVFSMSLVLLVVLLSASSPKKMHSILNTNQRFVKVSDNFYADKYEVSIKDYQLFLQDKRAKGEDCSVWIYDSTCWEMRNTTGETAPEIMIPYYYNLKVYENFPIVGVNYEAANEFCRWLAEKYHANVKRQYKQVVFRLPTEQEFIKAASAHYDPKRIFYPWGYNGLYNSKKEKRCNFWELDQVELDFTDDNLKLKGIVSQVLRTVENVGSYEPNPYGIYNIVGNVSEMIQEKHIAMGGDWQSTGYNVKITSKRSYKDVDMTVGFRVYMEIIEF